MAGEVVADDQAAHLGRVRQRVAQPVRAPARERDDDRSIEREPFDDRAQVADVVLPRVPRLGDVAAATAAHVDHDDATITERVEQPRVLVGVLPHARDREHRGQRSVGAPVVEHVQLHVVVVDEHRHVGHRYAPPQAGPPRTYSHISMP